MWITRLTVKYPLTTINAGYTALSGHLRRIKDKGQLRLRFSYLAYSHIILPDTLGYCVRWRDVFLCYAVNMLDIVLTFFKV